MVAVLTRHRPEADRCRIGETEVPVSPAQPTVAIEKFPVSQNESEMRFGIQVVANPPNHHVGGFPIRPVGHIVQVPGSFVIGKEQPDRCVAYFAGHLAAIPRVQNGSRVHEVHRSRQPENFLPLQKERPQFGKEQRKPLVHRNLWPVRLNLRKIRIVGKVERQV